MKRSLYEEEHEMFRASFREFCARHVAPHHAQWEREGGVPTSVWKEAGAQGFLGMAVPEEYGGMGIGDFRFNAVIAEEIAALGFSGLGFNLHSDVALPYLLDLATDEQKARWLPGTVSGETILAIAMTEPGTGSDLAAISSTALPTRDGGYVLNGAKMFITNGVNADAVIVVARTGESSALSLFVVERGMPGFERGRPLEKIGMQAQDTAELSFTDVRLPAGALLGERGRGLRYLMEHLPQERLSVAVASVASAQAALDETLAYVQGRKAFGQAIGAFQHVRFTLADLATRIAVERSFVDAAVVAHLEGELNAAEAAMAKYSATELLGEVVDACLQLHGGYGYMTEYPIARRFLDARVQRIYAGTSEIMREVIGRSLGL